MLRDLARAFVLVAALAACSSPSQRADVARSASNARFDVEHYALDLVLDPAARSVRGTCRIRLWPTIAPIDAVELDLIGLRVEGVTDVEGRALSFEQDEHGVHVELAERVLLDAYAEITVRYAGRPATGLYWSAERDGVPTQAWTHGECVDARAWFPCQDEPWDRATSELVVRVPRGWSVYAAGERLERRDEGAHTVERWRARFPHPPYLATLVAGEFAELTSTWDGIPLTFAASPRLAEHLAPTFAETDEVLAFLSKATGVRYPYPKYAQIAVDGFQYGGMENISASTLVDTAVTDAIGLVDAPATGLVAHEAAHQWFGDLVTCADWSHAWLNEGFATYFTNLYTEHARGRDAFLVEMAEQRERWLAIDRGANRRPMVHLGAGDPILAFFSGHVYDGGAVRLHHLRGLLGDDAFFRGVHLYLGENAGRGVVTDDLRRAFEASSGRDLRTHFERWFHAVGHPRVAFAARHDAARGELSIDVRQTQEDAPFPCLVEVEIADERGVRVERLELEGRGETYVVKQPLAPRWVRLDPNGALPAEIVETRSHAEWIALLEIGPDAAARRNAARVLVDASGRTTETDLRARIASVLRAAMSRDASPTVRRVIAAGTRPADDPEARAALLARVRDDVDPSVRAAALRALEPSRADAEIAQVAQREIERAASYAAVGAALGVLVRARPEHALATLESELAAPSPHGERAARVVAEIARLDDPRAADVLRRVAADESLADGPRRAAIAALARTAPTDAGARDVLLALLDSQRAPLRREAIRALTNVPTAEVRARLGAHAERTTDGRERAAIERALAAVP